MPVLYHVVSGVTDRHRVARAGYRGRHGSLSYEENPLPPRRSNERFSSLSTRFLYAVPNKHISACLSCFEYRHIRQSCNLRVLAALLFLTGVSSRGLGLRHWSSDVKA